MNALNKELSTVEKSISNLLTALEQGVVTPSTKKRLEELEARQEDINARILVERVRLTVQLSKEEIVKYLKTAIKKSLSK